MLLIGVQKIKLSAKESFSRSISGTDLIVGARSGDVQLLLYTVFRQGQPVANISWESVTDINAFREVKWVVPVSLGDSHKGYPVLGTSKAYFDHYKYGDKKNLSLREGATFNTHSEVVLGAVVAKALKYSLGDVIYLSHGIAKGGLSLHKNNPFRIVGILKPTGTPVDKTVHISLEGITALHVDDAPHADLSPKSVTGAFVGLKSKFTIFNVQRRITNWASEPLMAIIPGVSLSRLWQTVSTVDAALAAITVLVALITFLGLLLSLFMSLEQRRRELAILRTLGAHPSQLFFVLVLESLMITVSGVGLGVVLIGSVGTLLKPILEDKMGLILSLSSVTSTEMILVLGIIIFGVLTSLVPAYLAYKRSLSEGFISL